MSPIKSDHIVHSPYDKDLKKLPETTLTNFLWKRVSEFSHWENSIFLTCGKTGNLLSFGETRNKSRKFGFSLRKILGLHKSDIVFIILPNCMEFAVSFLGIIEANCIASLINPGYKTDELLHLFSIASPKCVITCEDKLQDILWLKNNLNASFQVILTDGKASSFAYSYNDLLVPGDTDEPKLEDTLFSGHDTAMILYSSGTTGLPKAVMLSHLSLCASLMQQSQTAAAGHYIINPYAFGNEQERLILPLPMFHIYGIQVGMMYSLFQGAQLIILPNFGHDLLLKCIRKYKPTVWEVVPPMLKYFVNSNEVKSADFESVKCTLCGAAPLGETLEKKFAQKFPGVKLIQAYGLSETCGTIITSSRLNSKYSKPGSIGVLLPGVYGKVVNPEDGNSLGPNLEGEICFMGYQIMTGYMGNKISTDNAIDKDGWLHSGDIGYYDNDGCFFIVDRLKEIIKYRGFQISPSEIENILRKIPGILDVAVIGVINDDEEEVPKAFVVRENSSTLTELEALNFVKERVVDYKRLRGGVEFVDKIPTSAAGKILRRHLK